MVLRTLQILIFSVSLISLQGCFSFHSTTVSDNPPTQTTTVVHEPAGNDVAVTTNH